MNQRNSGAKRKAQVAAWALFSCFAVPLRELPAQAVDFADVPPGAREAALGRATVALIGHGDGRGANPALLAQSGRATAVAGYASSEVTDVADSRLGASLEYARFGAFAIDVRYREVRNLIDDPELASDPGLTVSDWAVRTTYALLVGKRVAAGVSVERLASTIFGTKGSGVSFSVGAVAPITKRLAIGASAAQLGKPYRWRDVQGSETRSPLGQALVAGLSLEAFTSEWLSATVVGDLERGLGRRSAVSISRAGAEVQIAKVLFLRAGINRRHGANPTVRPSGGVGLRVGKIEIDLAKDNIGAEIGERTLIDVRVSAK